MGFRYSIKASFVLTAKNFFPYIAELFGRLVAFQESNQCSHTKCGYERAFIFIFSRLSLYFALPNILLFATYNAVFCSDFSKVKAPNINKLILTKNYWCMPCRTLDENSQFFLVKSTVIQLIYCSYYNKEKKKQEIYWEKSNCGV